MTWERWVWCSKCGHNSRAEISLPESIHCSDCGRLLGRLETPTPRAWGATFDSRHEHVLDTETDETLSAVEWDTERVTIHDGGDR